MGGTRPPRPPCGGAPGSTLTFTDGSKTEEGVGCAFVCGRDTRSFSLPEHSSVFSAELVAIDKALRFIEVSDDTEHAILTDSLSSLLALRAFHPSNPLVQDILSLLTSLDHAGISVSFCWIPSHVGIAGNEQADAAARRAATRPCTRRFPLPAGDLFPSVATFLRCQWQRKWDAQTNNKLKEVKPVLGHWPSSSRKSRREEVALSRLRIGHCYSTHSYLLRGEDRPSCPHCDVPLTVAHVLLACPRHRASQNRGSEQAKNRRGEAKRRAMKMEEEARARSFRTFATEELNRPANIGRIHKILRKMEGAVQAPPGQALGDHGRRAVEDRDKAESFAKTYASVSRQVRDKFQNRRIKRELKERCKEGCLCGGARSEACSLFVASGAGRAAAQHEDRKSARPRQHLR